MTEEQRKTSKFSANPSGTTQIRNEVIKCLITDGTDKMRAQVKQSSKEQKMQEPK